VPIVSLGEWAAVHTVRVIDSLKGIGIVQAYNTVTSKPRISSQIMPVVFTEGQRAHQGAVLATRLGIGTVT
jgi:hypothetical protein